MERFEALLVAEIPRLRRYARALTGDPARADDLLQDCLARALERRRLWLRARGIRGWLLAIMHNLYVNEVARGARAPHLAPIDAEQHPAVARADGELAMRELDRALAALPLEQREMVLLVGLEGLSYREAARAVGVPVGTVMSRLARGRERLRGLLHGEAGAALRALR